jgi:DNA-binding IclR family transcriptional regulator
MNGNQTLSRALDIIFTLAESPSTLTVTQIAEKVSIPESTAYRFIQILEQNGIVDRKKKGEIALGLRILDLARSLHQQIDRKLLELSRPLMEKLSETTGETIVLAIRSGMYAVCISSMESRRLIRVVIENGRTLPLHTGATGKAILAHESPKIVDQVLRDHLRRNRRGCVRRVGPGLRYPEPGHRQPDHRRTAEPVRGAASSGAAAVRSGARAIARSRLGQPAFGCSIDRGSHGPN